MAQIEKKGLANTDGYLRLFQLGLEMEEVLQGSQEIYDSHLERMGLRRGAFIRDAVECVLQLMDYERGPFVPLILEEYAMSLRRMAQARRRNIKALEEQIKGDDLNSRQNNAIFERIKLLTESIEHLEKQAIYFRRPIAHIKKELADELRKAHEKDKKVKLKLTDRFEVVEAEAPSNRD